MDEMNEIRSKVNGDLLLCGYNSDCVVEWREILSAIGKLKLNKSDGNVGLSSDFFINANKDLSVHTALLFSALLVHGSVPRDFLLSTVIPIP